MKKFNVNKKLLNKKDPSLFELFQLGDRVKRTYLDGNGNTEEYSGIIMAIYTDSIDIYWDSLDGRYQPQKIENIFNNYKLKDIFNGNKNYSPIKKNKDIFKDIFNYL